MTVQYVVPEYAHQIWPKVEGFLDDACAYARGDFTVDQAKVCVIRGDWYLLIDLDDNDPNVIHGAATIQFITNINSRVGFITLIGGKMISTPENFTQLVKFVKSHGATCMQGAARPSIARLWRKLFNFYEKHTIVELKI